MGNQSRPTVCPACLPNTVNYIIPPGGGSIEFRCFNPQGIPGPHKFEDLEQLRNALAFAKDRYPQHYQGPKPAPQVERAAGPITVSVETIALLEKLAKTTIRSESELKGVLFDAITTKD